MINTFLGTPGLDYFLWGFIKNEVYVRKKQNLEDLKASKSAAFRPVIDTMLRSNISKFVKRINKVIEVRGRHVE